MEHTIVNEVIAALVSAIALYVGFINRMRTQISVLEEKVRHMEQRQDSHSKKNDEIIELITDLKIEVVKKMSDVSLQMGKISSDVENINSTIAIFDSGIVSKNTKKKGVK